MRESLRNMVRTLDCLFFFFKIKKCVQRRVIESSGGSSLASLHGSRIEKGTSGSTIGQLSDAKKDCDSSVPDHIAMSLWALKKEGKI